MNTKHVDSIDSLLNNLISLVKPYARFIEYGLPPTDNTSENTAVVEGSAIVLDDQPLLLPEVKHERAEKSTHRQ